MHSRPSPPWLVVIAASSGGTLALTALVSRLPADLPAAVLIASHTPITSHRRLALLLSAAGPLPASYPTEGQQLEAGRIFIAPPDQHLVVQGRRVHLTSGAKEHGMRPAADVLFRSAALEFGARSVGIVLSGGGHDGAAGLAAIQAAGGRALIQAPGDARLAKMPLSALAAVTPDACVPAAELGPLVVGFARERGLADRGTPRVLAPREDRRERALSLSGLRVFVAEDEYLIASEIVDMLRALGCSAVGPVADVDMGLRSLERLDEPPDCAVLDMDLRGQSVLPLASELGRRGIPFVFATGYGGAILPEEWEGALRILKPYDAGALDTALRHALRMRWSPPTASSASASGITSREEALKNSRNLLMRAHALQASSSGKRLMHAQDALRRTDEGIAPSALRKQSVRRPRRGPSTSAKARADDEDGT